MFWLEQVAAPHARQGDQTEQSLPPVLQNTGNERLVIRAQRIQSC